MSQATESLFAENHEHFFNSIGHVWTAPAVQEECSPGGALTSTATAVAPLPIYRGQARSRPVAICAREHRSLRSRSAALAVAALDRVTLPPPIEEDRTQNQHAGGNK